MVTHFKNDNLEIKNSIKPLISIITVVYNSERFIEKTIKSIIDQTYSEIEYIIIDGDSTDGTIEVIKKYEKYISKWISEKDNGLYHAMNKAIEMASGDYLWFINSGDEIYTENILSDIFSKIDDLPDVIYGETEIINFKGQSLGMRRHTTPKKLTWRSLRFGMRVCHQSIIVKRELIETYTTDYKYSADFEWVIRILKKSKDTYNSKLILSKFMEGGITKQSMFPSLKERYSIMKKYYGLIPTIFNHFYLGLKLSFFYLKNKRF